MFPSCASRSSAPHPARRAPRLPRGARRGGARRDPCARYLSGLVRGLDRGRERISRVPLLLSPVYHERSGERARAELRRVAAERSRPALASSSTRRGRKSASRKPASASRRPTSSARRSTCGARAHPRRTRRAGFPRDKLLVSFVGRLVPAKGIDLLVRAFAEAVRALRAEGHEAGRRRHLAVAGFREGGWRPARRGGARRGRARHDGACPTARGRSRQPLARRLDLRAAVAVRHVRDRRPRGVGDGEPRARQRSLGATYVVPRRGRTASSAPTGAGPSGWPSRYGRWDSRG